MDKRYKILLVEDDRIDQIAFQRYVETEKLLYDYQIADSIEQATSIILSNKFDAVITDYLLRDGTAFDIFHLLKDTPIIFVTGGGNEQVAVKAIKSGAYDYLIKDIERNYLGFLPITVYNAITHKKAEDELKVAEQKIDKLSWVASKTDNAIVITNNKGQIEWVNEGFTRLSHYTLEEVKGTCGEVLRKGGATGTTPGSEYFNKLVKGKASVTYEAYNYNKENVGYWVLSTITPQLNMAGELERIIVIDLDITLRKQMEEELVVAKQIAEDSLARTGETLHELLKAKKQLEETMKIKEKFLANMSHEIRTPMNGIIGLTDVLLRTSLNEDQREYLSAIKNSSDTLLVVINDILDISKMEAGKMSLEQIPFKIVSIIEMLQDLFCSRAAEKGLEFKINIDKEIPVHLLGDPVRLNQILMNLASNAIKFTKKGGVEICARLTEEIEDSVKIIFTVKDTGKGIPTDQLDSIFLDYTQVGTEISREFGGTGLGLAISKRLAQLHNGTIKVESEVGKGSTFTTELWFKKCKDHTEIVDHVGIIEEFDHNELKGLRVLVVEDNAINLLLAEKLLSNWNCSVQSASNGKMAIEKLQENSFDIILMDIKMPEMDGYEATEYIRKKMGKSVSHLPIIALTAHAAIWEAERCIDAGMNDYITKPFDSKDLFNKLKKHTKDKPPAETNTSEEIFARHIDLSYLRKMSNGNEEFINKMVNTFVEEMSKETERMKLQLLEQNWDSLYQTAHKVKPSFQLVGITRLENVLWQIEQYAGQKINLDRIPPLVTEVINVFNESAEELKFDLLQK